MQMYINYFDHEVKTAEENPTVGILLCAKAALHQAGHHRVDPFSGTPSPDLGVSLSVIRGCWWFGGGFESSNVMEV